MSNNNNQLLGWLVIAGLFVFILIAILQVLTVIFMILTIFSILAVIVLLFLGFTNLNNDYDDEPYFIYALIAFLCVFAFFFCGQATYSASEALQNNEITSGLMQVTATFFFIQEQKQEAINQIQDAQIQALNNLTEEVNKQSRK